METTLRLDAGRHEPPPNPQFWAQAAARAASLLVLDDLATRTPLVHLIDILTRLASPDAATRSAAATPYGRLFRDLASAGHDLSDAFAAAIATSETLIVRHLQGSGHAMPSAIMEAAIHDLDVIAKLTALGAAIPDAIAETLGVDPAHGGLPALPDRRVRPEGQGEPTLNLRDLAGRAGVESLVTHYSMHGSGHFARARAFVWRGATGTNQLSGFDPVMVHDPIRAHDLVGTVDARALLRRNTANLLRGRPANNVLLYGDRGTGKSSSVKSLLQEPDTAAWGDDPDAGSVPWGLLRLIDVPKSRLGDFPTLITCLRGRPERFILFVDDLSFEDGETQYKDLKAVLDGGVTARPENVVVYATSNRRHLIREQFSDRPDPLNTDVHGQDTVQEKLSFADRFGLTLTFLSPNQEEYLAIATHLAQLRGLPIAIPDLRRRAIAWAAWHNGRSGRTARQFIDDLAAELG
ncbi:MAG: ATP-binding protein [Chloroflexi bacterium]|nr:ATP-binding protein [Chloroflexota bacterium]